MSMNSVDPFSQLASRNPVPSDRVLASLREELKGDDHPRRALSTAGRVALSAGALLLGLVLTSASALKVAPAALLISGAALSLSVAGLLLGGAIPGRKGRFGISGRRLLVAVLAIFGFTALALQAEEFVTLAQFLEPAPMKAAATCARHSLLSGVVGASALLFIWRRTDPFSPGLTGSLLGLFGGISGTLSVGLLCGHGEGLHLTVSHGISLIALSVLGLIIGRKWLSP